eukprot:SAG31_NODE_123_length_23712_cov_41.426291_4_plen_97_part_00
MIIHHLQGKTSYAFDTMKIIFGTTDSTETTSIAVKLPLGCVVVVETAFFAKILTKFLLATRAVRCNWLSQVTNRTDNFLHLRPVQLVRLIHFAANR